MRTYGGSFTENFYGLKRERVLRVRGGEIPRASLGAPEAVREVLKLRDVDVWKNLAVLVGLPYLKRKLDEAYDIHAAHATVLGPRYAQDSLPPNASLKARFMFYYKWFLRKIYPSINAAYYFSLLAFNLMYLYDGSKYSSPFLWLIGTRIRRMSAADHRAIALATQPKAPSGARAVRPGQANSIFSPSLLTQTVYPRMLSSLRILLPTSVFALKFLEWWHASDFARQLQRTAAEGIDLPPPVVSGLSSTEGHRTKQDSDPVRPPTLTGEKMAAQASSPPPKRSPPISVSTSLPILTVSVARSSDLCPICSSPIVTPTAAQTGYVFCYTCIHKWVEGSHERQIAFMEGGGGLEGWAEVEGNREGKWESGHGRCAVTGRKLLGGTEGLRRVVA